jgi:hypothetical protein
MRKSKRELAREVSGLAVDTDVDSAVPLIVPDNALPEDHPDREVSADGVRQTVDDETCDLQLPHTRPSNVDLFGDAIPLITEAGVVRLWESMPDGVAESERELREARDEPIPNALGAVATP